MLITRQGDNLGKSSMVCEVGFALADSIRKQHNANIVRVLIRGHFSGNQGLVIRYHCPFIRKFWPACFLLKGCKVRFSELLSIVVKTVEWLLRNFNKHCSFIVLDAALKFELLLTAGSTYLSLVLCCVITFDVLS